MEDREKRQEKAREREARESRWHHSQLKQKEDQKTLPAKMLLSDENRTFLRFCAKIKGQGVVYKPDLKNGIRFGILNS